MIGRQQRLEYSGHGGNVGVIHQQVDARNRAELGKRFLRGGDGGIDHRTFLDDAVAQSHREGLGCANHLARETQLEGAGHAHASQQPLGPTKPWNDAQLDLGLPKLGLGTGVDKVARQGELVAAALDAGCTRVLLGVGGSATTDGGAGMLAALGLRLRLVASPALDRLVGDAVELHLFDRGYAGVVRQEDGSANICLAVRRSRLHEVGDRLLWVSRGCAYWGPPMRLGAPREIALLTLRSQPAAASLPDLLGAVAIRSLIGVVDQTQRSLTGVNVLWLGETRY